MIHRRILLNITRSLIGSRLIVSRNFQVKSQDRLCCKYIQGQSPEPRVREYFYYIDHQGMLHEEFVHVSDKEFLVFFFRRLRLNKSDRYTKHFPFVSLCGRERNYVRCDDLPIVFTHVTEKIDPKAQTREEHFSYGYAGDLLTVPFEPKKIFMNPTTGRVYHPAPTHLGGIGLVKSSLAIEFSSFFSFEHGEEHGPTQFMWRHTKYDLDTNWYKDNMLKLSYKV